MRLTALQELSLWGNPLLMPLRALNEAGLDMVLAYLAIFHSAQVSGSLDLRGMDLLRLPAEAELAPLREVFLGGNRFAALPAELCAAAGLTALDASQGKLQTVPPAVFEGLTNLRSLNLAGNRLKIVEATLGYLEVPPSPSRTNRIRLVPPPVLTGHVSSLPRGTPPHRLPAPPPRSKNAACARV